MAWRNCNSSNVLVAQVNRKWPNRSKTSDGTIGDAAHATRQSDHNPWITVNGVGVVRARDIDKDGVDLNWLFECLRRLGAQGDPRLAGGGYLIWNRRITTPDFSRWVAYTGSNPHTAHGHISWSRNRGGFDSNSPFSFFGGTTGSVGTATGGRVLNNKMAYEGERGADVAWIQQRLNIHGVSCTIDANFGPATTAAVKLFQQRRRLTADGRVGPNTRDALAAAPPRSSAIRPVLRPGMNGPYVKALQERLATRYPSYAREHGNLTVDGDFGPTTAAWVKEFKGRVGLPADSVVAARAWKALGF